MHSVYLINELLRGIYYLKQSWLQMNSWSKTWIVKYDNNNKKDESRKDNFTIARCLCGICSHL